MFPVETQPIGVMWRGYLSLYRTNHTQDQTQYITSFSAKVTGIVELTITMLMNTIHANQLQVTPVITPCYITCSPLLG